MYHYVSKVFHAHIPKELHKQFLNDFNSLEEEGTLMSVKEIVEYFSSSGIKIKEEYRSDWDQIVEHYNKGYVEYGENLLRNNQLYFEGKALDPPAQLDFDKYIEWNSSRADGDVAFLAKSSTQNYNSALHIAWQAIIYDRDPICTLEFYEIIFDSEPQSISYDSAIKCIKERAPEFYNLQQQYFKKTEEIYSIWLEDDLDDLFVFVYDEYYLVWNWYATG